MMPSTIITPRGTSHPGFHALTTCIDESMNSWLNKFCPGFMTLPCKPHPFGNGYYLIVDSDGGKPIMWGFKIVDGKDHQKKADRTWAFPSKYKIMGYSKTINLLLDMTKVRSSSFQNLASMGILIKKQEYCRSMIPATTLMATRWQQSHWATRRCFLK